MVAFEEVLARQRVKPRPEWLRGVLASAPRDVPDEVDLDALFEAAASTPAPPGVCVFGQAALRALLGQLEADNQIMVVDATIYLV